MVEDPAAAMRLDSLLRRAQVVDEHGNARGPGFAERVRVRLRPDGEDADERRPDLVHLAGELMSLVGTVHHTEVPELLGHVAQEVELEAAGGVELDEPLDEGRSLVHVEGPGNHDPDPAAQVRHRFHRVERKVPAVLDQVERRVGQLRVRPPVDGAGRRRRGHEGIAVGAACVPPPVASPSPTRA